MRPWINKISSTAEFTNLPFDYICYTIKGTVFFFSAIVQQNVSENEPGCPARAWKAKLASVSIAAPEGKKKNINLHLVDHSAQVSSLCWR